MGERRAPGLKGRGWVLGALGFAVGYGLLRLYWAAGGRVGFTACDRARAPSAADLATGCVVEHQTALPLWQDWGAVGLCGVLVAVAVRAARRGDRAAGVGAWVACAALVTLSFPMHLLFEIPAGVAGRPTDWLDLAGRLLLLGGGLLFGATAASLGTHRCGHPRPRPTGPRPVPRWVRGWAAAAAVVPVLGWTVPHTLWLLGVPLGIPPEEVTAIRRDLSPALGLAITLIPSLGGLLTLGLARPWGQLIPRWILGLAGRPVPRVLALAPAGVVAVALTSYSLISAVVIGESLLAGTVTWSQLAAGWVVAGTGLVFLGWGVALGVTALGYERVTRPRCETCRPPAAAADGLCWGEDRANIQT